jgi:hypothetical protein
MLSAATNFSISLATTVFGSLEENGKRLPLRDRLPYPATKRVSADEDNHASQQTLEKVEDGNRSDTHEIEESSLHTEVGKRFV